MTPLRDRKCRECAPGTPALDAEQARKLLSGLDKGWRITDDVKSLRRAFAFEDFHRTMAFVNALAWIAHTEDHHPDFEVGYGYCRVEFSTHSIGGLSENDFICAAKTDALGPGTSG
jgi:4a-hydroxytetrahydrobiopterin dehydratase